MLFRSVFFWHKLIFLSLYLHSPYSRSLISCGLISLWLCASLLANIFPHGPNATRNPFGHLLIPPSSALFGQTMDFVVPEGQDPCPEWIVTRSYLCQRPSPSAGLDHDRCVWTDFDAILVRLGATFGTIIRLLSLFSHLGQHEHLRF